LIKARFSKKTGGEGEEFGEVSNPFRDPNSQSRKKNFLRETQKSKSISPNGSIKGEHILRGYTARPGQRVVARGLKFDLHVRREIRSSAGGQVAMATDRENRVAGADQYERDSSVPVLPVPRCRALSRSPIRSLVRSVRSPGAP